MNRKCTQCNNIFRIPEGHEDDELCCPFCESVVGSEGNTSELLYSSALASGTEIGGSYIIEDTIRQRSFEIIYKARDKKSDSQVIVKEYFPDGILVRSEGSYVSMHSEVESGTYESGKRDFIKLANKLKELNGFWGIPEVLDVLEGNGTAYVVMEYLKGRKLKEYMPEGHIMSWEQVESAVFQMLDILQTLHDRGVIHRNITADNILVDSKGTFKLLDFGMDKGDGVGVLDDIYAVGSILYRAFTGKYPPSKKDREAGTEFLPVYAMNSEVSVELSDMVMKAIALQEEDRYQSIGEFKADIERLQWSESEDEPGYEDQGNQATEDAADLPPENSGPIQGKKHKRKSYEENIRSGNWMVLRILLIIILFMILGIIMIINIGIYKGPAPEETATGVDLSRDGKVLNIQCWNTEFITRLAEHYPGFVLNDPDDVSKGGKIGDIEVKLSITPSDNEAYQNNLDVVLKDNASKEEDDRVDIFLVEADYALKYVDTDYTVPISELGIDVEKELVTQYAYTKNIVTDSLGRLKGVSWQVCPGVMIYNRDAAKKVFGSDNPNTVQTKVENWYEYKKVAELMYEKGYQMTSSVEDTYRVFANNASAPWVVDGRIRIDDQMKAWVDMSREQVEKGYTTTADLWSAEWAKGFAADSNVFCYFGPAWLINFSMGNIDNGKNEDDGSRCFKGGWAATTGPQGFFWGGTWICAANGTDNPALIADIMRKMTTDAEIMSAIVKDDNDFVNNIPAMRNAATDDSYAFKSLGGQNPIGLFVKGADRIKIDNLSKYDQGCNNSFLGEMKGYIRQEMTYEEAVKNFKKSVKNKYPELD
ncbi:MAG: protein kinase [Eubacterium sp.]|nr:protein kinase [Eubacterium sp.]